MDTSTQHGNTDPGLAQGQGTVADLECHAGYYHTDGEWAALRMRRHAGSPMTTPLDMPKAETWLPNTAGAVRARPSRWEGNLVRSTTAAMTDGPAPGPRAVTISSTLGITTHAHLAHD